MPNPLRNKSRKFILLLVGGLVVVGFGLIQLVPYRVDNPPRRPGTGVGQPADATLAVAVCFDCHSNETTRSGGKTSRRSLVDHEPCGEGRSELNFSECTKEFDDRGEGRKRSERSSA